MRNARVGFVFFLVLGVLTAPMAPAAGEADETQPGNPTCADVDAEWSAIYKAELDGNAASAGSQDAVSWVLSAGAGGQLVEWGATTDVVGVLVGGGRHGSAVYRYDPAARGDTGLHAPVNPSGRWADVSHITFCAPPEGESPPDTGTIILEKVTHPANTTAEFAFSTSIPGWSPRLRNGDAASVEVPPGGYTVSEDLAGHATKGWALSSIACDDPTAVVDLADPTTGGSVTVDVAAGETVTCVFTNTEYCPFHGKLVIEKRTDPAGVDASFAFTTDVTWKSAVFAPRLGHGESAWTWAHPGTYTITEALPAGWELSDVTCDTANASFDPGAALATVELQPGDVVTCSFTNRQTGAQPGNGTLVVAKATNPAGASDTFPFTSSIDGFAPVLGDGESAAVHVDAGSHRVTETRIEGWELTEITCTDPDALIDLAAGDAAVTISEGETVLCTFTNTETAVGPESGTLVIEKATDTPGAVDRFQFTTTVEGWNPTLAGGESAVTRVTTGIYTIVEAEADGWRLSAIECTGAAKVDLDGRAVAIQVGDGAAVTCTFINSRAEQPGAIGDYVWHDANANGVQDSGEQGVPGVRVNLYRAAAEGQVEEISGRVLASEEVAVGTLIATARTDAGGRYLIEDVPAGEYIVEFTDLPEGFVFTRRFAGNDKLVDSDVELDSGRTGVMLLAAGFVDLTCDAGIIILAQEEDDTLPVTGGALRWPTAAGVLLVASGVLMLAGGRRRDERLRRARAVPSPARR